MATKQRQQIYDVGDDPHILINCRISYMMGIQNGNSLLNAMRELGVYIVSKLCCLDNNTKPNHVAIAM